MLQARDVKFRYGDQTILNKVSLDVATGGITVLIGPSGGGKTTLLRCLALLERPESGVVSVDGEAYSFSSPEGRSGALPWPNITAVFQQLFLWPHMTLRENILLPARRRLASGVQDKLGALIEAFDMGNFIDRYPNEASLGQRQRVALARAAMLNPRYLLLDEITSALDVEQIARILGYLKSFRGENVGIFIITHLLGFARHAADHVAFMAGGEIVESGTAGILKNPQTERLSQFLSVIAAAS